MTDLIWLAGDVIILGMAFVVMAAALVVVGFMIWIIKEMLE